MAKLPSEHKLANSVEEFKLKIKTWKSDAGPADYAKQIKQILNKSPTNFPSKDSALELSDTCLAYFT